MCLAIKYAHDNKIIHRDIKTTNIFLDEFDNIKLGDFGTATNLLFTGQNFINFAGTPLYVSPEIINGIPYSYKADIWALGVVCYEILTGNSPFYDTNFAGLLTKICCSQPAPIENDFSFNLKEFTFSLLNKNHEHRPNINQIFKGQFILCNLEKFSDEKMQLNSMTTLPDFKLTEVQLEKEFKSMKSLRYSEFFEGPSNGSKAYSPEKKIELIDIIGSSLFFKNGVGKGLSSQASIGEIENHESLVIDDLPENLITSKICSNHNHRSGMEFLNIFQNSNLSEHCFKLGDLSQLLQVDNSNSVVRANNATQHTGSNLIDNSNISEELSVQMFRETQNLDIKTQSLGIKISETQSVSKFKNYTNGSEKLVRSEFTQKGQINSIKPSKMKIVSTFQPQISGKCVKVLKSEEKPIKSAFANCQPSQIRSKIDNRGKKNIDFDYKVIRSTKNTIKNDYISKNGVPKNPDRISKAYKGSLASVNDKLQRNPLCMNSNAKISYSMSSKDDKYEIPNSIKTLKKHLPSDLRGEFTASNITDNKTKKAQKSRAGLIPSKTSTKTSDVTKLSKVVKPLAKSNSKFVKSLTNEIRKFIMNYGCLEVEGLLQNKQSLKELFQLTGHGSLDNEDDFEILCQVVKSSLDTIRSQFMSINV